MSAAQTTCEHGPWLSTLLVMTATNVEFCHNDASRGTVTGKWLRWCRTNHLTVFTNIGSPHYNNTVRAFQAPRYAFHLINSVLLSLFSDEVQDATVPTRLPKTLVQVSVEVETDPVVPWGSTYLNRGKCSMFHWLHEDKLEWYDVHGACHYTYCVGVQAEPEPSISRRRRRLTQ